MLFGMFSCTSSKLVTKNVEQTLVNEDTFLVTEVSTNASYGYSPKNPVEVGGGIDSGPLNERRYLNALTGPNGEAVAYIRSGSCCPTKSPNAVFGNKVVLDNYRVTWEGSNDTVSIYINMYDSGKLLAPKGFGIR